MSSMILLARLKDTLGRRRNIVVMLAATLLLGIGAIPYDVPGVELGHHDGKCSFEAIVSKYRIEDRAILLLSKIVHGADVAEDLYGRPEAAGLEAIAEGFRHLGLKDDHEVLAKEFIVYDALYAYCQEEVGLGVTNRGSPL
ncbi:MAG: chromate resistance protein ChrB domain-containing protein [Gammaproteobacteria bacterium]